jgi:hypothetical protein
MPFNKALYPPNWEETCARILQRAGHQCEHCGVAHRAIGYRDRAGNWVQIADSRANAGPGLGAHTPEGHRILEVVLTIAHLDRSTGDPELDGPLDCPDNRLAALCQYHHLMLDMPRHKAHRARVHEEPSVVSLLLEHQNHQQRSAGD